MKKAIIVGLALIPILLFITSCGVAQEEYDKVSSDLAAAQTQIKSLQDNLTAAQGDLTAAQAQIQSFQSEQATLKGKIDDSKARIEVLNALFVPALTGELDRMTEAEAISFLFEWRDKIKDVGDTALTAKFEAMMQTFSYEAVLSFFVYLLESTADTLE